VVGVAGSTGCSFGSPLAGCLLAFELLMNMRTLGGMLLLVGVCTISANWSAQNLTEFLHDEVRNHFSRDWFAQTIPIRNNYTVYAILLGALLGAVCAGIGCCFARVVNKIQHTLNHGDFFMVHGHLRKYIGFPVGLFTGLCGVLCFHVTNMKTGFLPGHDTIEYIAVQYSCAERSDGVPFASETFYNDNSSSTSSSECIAAFDYFIIFVTKFAACALACGVEAPGGIWVPSLVIGQSFGGLSIAFLAWLFPGADAGLWRTCTYLGMAGVFASIVRAPVTGLLLIYFLCGSAKVGFVTSLTAPLLACAMTSFLFTNYMGDYGGHEGIVLMQAGLRLDTLWSKGTQAIAEVGHILEDLPRWKYLLKVANDTQKELREEGLARVCRLLNTNDIRGLHNQLVTNRSLQADEDDESDIAGLPTGFSGTGTMLMGGGGSTSGSSAGGVAGQGSPRPIDTAGLFRTRFNAALSAPLPESSVSFAQLTTNVAQKLSGASLISPQPQGEVEDRGTTAEPAQPHGSSHEVMTSSPTVISETAHANSGLGGLMLPSQQYSLEDPGSGSPMGLMLTRTGPRTPLGLAIAKKAEEGAHLLLFKNADPNARSADRSLLSHVIENKLIDTGRRLLAYGARLDEETLRTCAKTTLACLKRHTDRMQAAAGGGLPSSSSSEGVGSVKNGTSKGDQNSVPLVPFDELAEAMLFRELVQWALRHGLEATVLHIFIQEDPSGQLCRLALQVAAIDAMELFFQKFALLSDGIEGLFLAPARTPTPSSAQVFAITDEPSSTSAFPLPVTPIARPAVIATTCNFRSEYPQVGDRDGDLGCAGSPDDMSADAGASSPSQLRLRAGRGPNMGGGLDGRAKKNRSASPSGGRMAGVPQFPQHFRSDSKGGHLATATRKMQDMFEECSRSGLLRQNSGDSSSHKRGFTKESGGAPSEHDFVGEESGISRNASTPVPYVASESPVYGANGNATATSTSDESPAWLDAEQALKEYFLGICGMSSERYSELWEARRPFKSLLAEARGKGRGASAGRFTLQINTPEGATSSANAIGHSTLPLPSVGGGGGSTLAVPTQEVVGPNTPSSLYSGIQFKPPAPDNEPSAASIDGSALTPSDQRSDEGRNTANPHAVEEPLGGHATMQPTRFESAFVNICGKAFPGAKRSLSWSWRDRLRAEVEAGTCRVKMYQGKLCRLMRTARLEVKVEQEKGKGKVLLQRVALDADGESLDGTNAESLMHVELLPSDQETTPWPPTAPPQRNKSTGGSGTTSDAVANKEGAHLMPIPSSSSKSNVRVPPLAATYKFKRPEFPKVPLHMSDAELFVRLMGKLNLQHIAKNDQKLRDALDMSCRIHIETHFLYEHEDEEYPGLGRVRMYQTWVVHLGGDGKHAGSLTEAQLALGLPLLEPVCVGGFVHFWRTDRRTSGERGLRSSKRMSGGPIAGEGAKIHRSGTMEAITIRG